MYAGGDHTHPLTVTSFDHSHSIVEHPAGGGAGFDITPVNFVMYAYVRS